MKTRLTFLILLSTVFFTTGCNELIDNKPEEGSGPIKLRPELQRRVAQDNAFALDLLKQTISESGETNVFISPLSVSIALGMVWNGAVGTTKTEMETTLKMSGMTIDEINEYYGIMVDSLPGVDGKTTLSIANSIWYLKNQDFSVKQAFLDVNSNYFDAEIQALDFSKPEAVTTINNWCARKTNNLIPEIIDRISGDVMMYLINAIYFKGTWAEQFDTKDTYESTFTTETGAQGPINMMYKESTVLYHSDALAQYIDMPYGNGAFSMTVVLPADGKTTSETLDYLTNEQFNAVLSEMDSATIMISLPRFKAECKYLLNNELMAMGMPLAFTDQADFSGISELALFISKVIHKTYIEVTEEGTEAAAVTAIEMVSTSIPSCPSFTVNKPFIFMIREKGTGVILFAGKMGAITRY